MEMDDLQLTVTAEEFFNNGSGFVTLCGSTRFFFECMELDRILTFKGWIVLKCGSWGHSYHKYVENTNTDYTRVKRLHYVKILNSQAVVVVSNASGYIGNSTRAEISFANSNNIPVFYFNGNELIGVVNCTPPSDYFASENDEIDNYQNRTGNSLGF
jgi:hypothetical protein